MIFFKYSFFLTVLVCLYIKQTQSGDMFSWIADSLQNTTKMKAGNWYHIKTPRIYLVSLHLIFVPTSL